jgi:hypothetical protein
MRAVSSVFAVSSTYSSIRPSSTGLRRYYSGFRFPPFAILVIFLGLTKCQLRLAVDGPTPGSFQETLISPPGKLAFPVLFSVILMALNSPLTRSSVEEDGVYLLEGIGDLATWYR